MKEKHTEVYTETVRRIQCTYLTHIYSAACQHTLHTHPQDSEGVIPFL